MHASTWLRDGDVKNLVNVTTVSGDVKGKLRLVVVTMTTAAAGGGGGGDDAACDVDGCHTV